MKAVCIAIILALGLSSCSKNNSSEGVSSDAINYAHLPLDRENSNGRDSVIGGHFLRFPDKKQIPDFLKRYYEIEQKISEIRRQKGRYDTTPIKGDEFLPEAVVNYKKVGKCEMNVVENTKMRSGGGQGDCRDCFPCAKVDLIADNERNEDDNILDEQMYRSKAVYCLSGDCQTTGVYKVDNFDGQTGSVLENGTSRYGVKGSEVSYLATVKFTDWGIFQDNILEQSAEFNRTMNFSYPPNLYFGMRYGALNISSPEEGVLLMEVMLDLPLTKLANVNTSSMTSPPLRKYYAFIAVANNRVSLSGYASLYHQRNEDTGNLMSDKEAAQVNKNTAWNFKIFDKKVAFYKDYIKQVDFKKLSEVSKPAY
ncbi:MAG: hypothetical protein ACO1N1_17455 [Dyadobacter fermentans]